MKAKKETRKSTLPTSSPAPVAADEFDASPVRDQLLLVQVTVRQRQFIKVDRKVSRETLERYGADKDGGRFEKALFAEDALKAVNKAAGSIRTAVRWNALPHSTPGLWIISTAHYAGREEEIGGKVVRIPGFVDRLRPAIQAFEEAAEAFLSNYDAYVSDSRLRLGEMFNAADYPPLSEVRGMFSVEIRVDPFPRSANWFVDLAEDEVARLRHNLDERVAHELEEATRDLWDKLHTSVETLARSLREYGEEITLKSGSTRSKSFKASVVENLRDLAGMLPALNVTGDPALNDLSSDLFETLGDLGADDLKENDAIRHETAKKLTGMQDRIAEMMRERSGKASAENRAEDPAEEGVNERVRQATRELRQEMHDLF